MQSCKDIERRVQAPKIMQLWRFPGFSTKFGIFGSGRIAMSKLCGEFPCHMKSKIIFSLHVKTFCSLRFSNH